MRLVSCTPGNSMTNLGRDIDEIFRGLSNFDQRKVRKYPVQMDLIEGEKQLTILVDLPGMEKDKIKVLVENDVLTISGERSREKDENKKVLFAERFYGSFSRSFNLPENVEKSGVSADYKNGILEVSIPKREETKPKEIEINVN